jgi:hypothetical protein
MAMPAVEAGHALNSLSPTAAFLHMVKDERWVIRRWRGIAE